MLLKLKDKRKRHKKGVTLVELLVTCVILCILAGMVGLIFGTTSTSINKGTDLARGKDVATSISTKFEASITNANSIFLLRNDNNETLAAPYITAENGRIIIKKSADEVVDFMPADNYKGLKADVTFDKQSPYVVTYKIILKNKNGQIIYNEVKTCEAKLMHGNSKKISEQDDKGSFKYIRITSN